MNQNPLRRTDLAAESHDFHCYREALGDSVSYSQKSLGSHEISEISINDPHGESLIGKPMGSYITVSFSKITEMDHNAREDLTKAVTESLCRLIKGLGTPINKVLVAGLGNRSLTADTVGPATAEAITLTRPISLSDPPLFRRLGHLETSMIIPAVLGETGIESSDLVKSAADIVKPDLIIAVDALAARSPKRLMNTIQLCDTGIAPGSGVGNKRPSIDRKTMGVPVIAIGVPTVVDSSALIYDALEGSGIPDKEIPKALEELLSNHKSFFVTSKDCDIVIKELCSMLSEAIDRALSVPEDATLQP